MLETVMLELGRLSMYSSADEMIGHAWLSR